MEIYNAYIIKSKDTQYFVYEGTCDGIPTKWITKSKWDGRIKIKMSKREGIKYIDSEGKEVLVLEEDDDEYYTFSPPN
jgi:hypothetical protein